MAFTHKDVHSGARWCLVFGAYAGPERFAVQELQRNVQRHLPYVVETREGAGEALRSEKHLVLIGTRENNPSIAELINRKLIADPPGEGGYTIAGLASPWGEDRKVMAVAGHDPAGVLAGVVDFNARALAALPAQSDSDEARRAFDAMERFEISERPLIDNRGIWTWGYVVYDYRGFLDNMARLKMNTLILWNDCPPLNAREVVDYAHSRGVKVIFGFHWGWGIDDLDLGNREHRARTREEVLRKWREDYRDLGADGLYFQTATEHDKLEIGGRSVAALARDWVNDIAGALLAEEPGLYIQFGLHAMSILDNYVDLVDLDPQVAIGWEDAGAIPYCYDPVPAYDQPGFAKPMELNTVEKTLDYSRKLATFRPGMEFAMVAKGWIKLRWGVEFEHHGPFVLGERDRDWIRRRIEERQARWDEVNDLWQRHYPLAARFYREMLDCSPAKMTVTGLIEDGMFGEVIQSSAAIFAETLWNPRRADEEILKLAGSPYYRAPR